MAYMYMPVCIRGPVMEDIVLAVLIFVLNLFIYPVIFPGLEHVRLSLGKVSLHREPCLREVQRVFIVFSLHCGSVVGGGKGDGGVTRC